ncbi:uncharacterized protein LOC111039616 [Myzus persicae]|uniref:uncharacterized protein LOC111039616 n=1 Tax=Myzus persicae TaxID=13164 RepID=UPI000B937FF3|nr:uncharacterized protein LOC111039616 [Myzus persicae]
MVLFIMQVKNEDVLLDSSDCQTKCPIRRQTIRSYPPGTALFVGDECVCGGSQETIYEYVPPVRQVETPVGFKRKTIESQSNNRVMGNYGSLVFSGNVQILNLLSIKNDNIRKGCCDRKPLNPSNDKIIMSTPSILGINLLTTTAISRFNKVSGKKNQQNTTPSGVKNCTDQNFSIITEPVLQNSFTTVSEFTSENIVTDEPDLSDQSTRSSVTQTSLDIEIPTSTVNPQQKEDSRVFTTEDPMISEQNSTCNYSKKSEKIPNLVKKPDFEILVINTNTIHLNNLLQRFRLKKL